MPREWPMEKNLSLKYVHTVLYIHTGLHPFFRGLVLFAFGLCEHILLSRTRLTEAQHNQHLGDEPMIERLFKMNRLGEKVAKI